LARETLPNSLIFAEDECDLEDSLTTSPDPEKVVEPSYVPLASLFRLEAKRISGELIWASVEGILIASGQAKSKAVAPKMPKEIRMFLFFNECLPERLLSRIARKNFFFSMIVRRKTGSNNPPFGWFWIEALRKPPALRRSGFRPGEKRRRSNLVRFVFLDFL